MSKFGTNSKLRLNKNPYRNLNKSVDSRIGSKRTKTSMIKSKRSDMNNSMLPDIKQQAQKRNISQVRRDQGEYSRMLANHDNNRLVQAQRTIDEAIRKHRAQNPNKQQRHNLGRLWLPFTSNPYCIVNDYFSNKRNMKTGAK